MTLQKWCEYGWLRSHAPSRQEIADLLGIVDRDLSDSKSGGISTEDNSCFISVSALTRKLLRRFTAFNHYPLQQGKLQER